MHILHGSIGSGSTQLHSCNESRWANLLACTHRCAASILNAAHSCIQGLVLRVSSSLASSKLYKLSRESLVGPEFSDNGGAAAPPPYATSAMLKTWDQTSARTAARQGVRINTSRFLMDPHEGNHGAP